MNRKEFKAKISAVASYFPATTLSNEQLSLDYRSWSAGKIFDKTGIRVRFIAGENETAGDLAFKAAERLLAKNNIAADSIDFLIFCTQSPDFILPSTCCLIHRRLALRADAGAIDVNQGCSGFIYCLSLAKGLITSGDAGRVLILTADTYSKYINPKDRSVRTLFGDAAAAVLVDRRQPCESSQIGDFIFGTDGSGASNLIVPTGGARRARSPESSVEHADEFGNTRSDDNLYMNGAEVMSFTLRAVPRVVQQLESRSGLLVGDCDFVVLHQANSFVLEALGKKLDVPHHKMPRRLENCGNTVSSTIPLVLENLMEQHSGTGKLGLLVGYGVGYSWAACHVWF